MTIAVLVPVLNRPANAFLVASSLAQSNADAILWFICSPGDDAQIEACKIAYGMSEINGCGMSTVRFEPGRGDWARKINAIAAHDGGLVLPPDECDWFLLGADDLRFHPGWDTEALAVAEKTGAGVVGTNDLGNPYVKRGALATHALVARWYAEQHGTIDEKGKILHEGYWHNWVDAELTETAISRGMFAFAPRSRIEHMHPNWGKAAMDDTYRIALDRQHFEEDRRLLQQRRRLWRNHRVSGARRARARR